jgi:hypothetical protein
MNNSNLDAGIPILTEIIGVSVENGVTDNSVTTSLNTITQSSEKETVSPKTFATDDIADEQVRHVENEVMERVLQQLLGRIDFMLEQRVRDSLADVLETTVQGLATEIRKGLQQTLEDVVARAVAQEVARLQIEKR